MFGDIIVGVDASPGGRDAITLARELGAPEARLTLAHVLTVPAWQPWASGAAHAAGERAYEHRATGPSRGEQSG